MWPKQCKSVQICLLVCVCVSKSVIGLIRSNHHRCHNSTNFHKKQKAQNINMVMMANRLSALRSLMASYEVPLAAFIIPTADAHNSEYIAETDARRAWLTGFTGSAGTAVVTSSQAVVWTDGRYYTQFEQEVRGMWTLMKQSLPETPTIKSWLAKNLKDGDVVGVDPHTYTREEWTPLQTTLTKSGIKLQPVTTNLVDEARRSLKDPPPPRPQNPIIPLGLKYTGKTAGAKIKELREKMAEQKTDALVVTALDEVAWTLNLRGSDIEYNPVFFSYLLITTDAVTLFCGDAEVTQAVADHFRAEDIAHIQVLPYGDVVSFLENRAKKLAESGEKHSIWLSVDASEAICVAASGSNVLEKPLNLITEMSPVALAKLIKNEIELEGFRKCHIKDAVAVIRFFRWLHRLVGTGATVSELQASKSLLAYRKEEQGFMGPSFETISSAGENGAIIHYSPSEKGEQRNICRDDMYLLDSGGQYLEGTTDITRTRHMSNTPTAEQKDAFTRVLKGQIMLGSSLFPQGVKGNVLDSFARRALWDVGLDYAHGTGHGVGHYLNVHEGPSGVSWRPYPHDPGLKPGQILSNEPGYYKVGKFGIRHEDLVETVEVKPNSQHPKAANLVGDYDGRGVLGFRTITLVPHQRQCIVVDLLDDFELKYLNDYHAEVLRVVGGELKARGLEEDWLWLVEECQPLVRTNKDPTSTTTVLHKKTSEV